MHRAADAVHCWLYCKPLLDRKSIPYGLGGTLVIEAVGATKLALTDELHLLAHAQAPGSLD